MGTRRSVEGHPLWFTVVGVSVQGLEHPSTLFFPPVGPRVCSGSQYKGWNIPLHSIPPPRRAQSVLGVSVQGLETSLHSPSPCCRAQTVLGVSAQGPGAPHVGDFSTDNHGHCYFYGERLDAGNTSKVCAGGGALGGGKQGEPAGEDKKCGCVCVKLPHIDLTAYCPYSTVPLRSWTTARGSTTRSTT